MKVRPVDPAAVTDPRWPSRPVLPAAGRARVAVGASAARAGSLPVWVQAAPGRGGPSAVEVRGLAQDEVSRVGGRFIAFEMTRSDGGAAPGPVKVEVDYSGVRDAFGGDFAGRLRLVRLPACALSSPEDPECLRGTVLAARNDLGTGRLHAELTADGDPAAPTDPAKGPAPQDAPTAASTVYAMTSSTSSQSGTFSATPLQASSRWEVGLNSGNFSYSYPFVMPPAVAGPVPDLTLGYSSQAVDGRTAAENSQPSWAGEGWNLAPGFIERRYGGCGADIDGSPWGDLCWQTPTYFMSFGAQSAELIADADGVFHLKDDPGWKITLATGATWNGDNDGEHWKVWAPDGTRYMFGYGWEPYSHKLTESAWTVPVFGDDAGEPCYKTSSIDTRYCQQAWRWNLDSVLDTKGNVATYFWQAESNYYARNGYPARVSQYERGGYPSRIEYSKRYSSTEITAAYNVVTLGVADRCEAQTSCPAPTSANSAAYPDVPLDLVCTSSTYCPGSEHYSPTFFTTKQLTSLTTYGHNGGGLANVNRYNFEYTFPSTGDGTSRSLWLKRIIRTGVIGSDANAVALPPVVMSGVRLPNRVDYNTDAGVPLTNKWRVAGIETELGGRINVTYDNPDPCVTSMQRDLNNNDCFPQKFDPDGDGPQGPGWGWFHKYVVMRVDVDDTVATSPTQSTIYTYLDDPAWHYDNNIIDTDTADPPEQSWSDYRGYGYVQVVSGATVGARTISDYRYFRGMHGDKQTSGTPRSVSVVDSEGTSRTDYEYMAGRLREHRGRGESGSVHSKTFHDYWAVTTANGPNGYQSHNAVFVRDDDTTTKVYDVAAGTWRSRRVATTFDTFGYPTRVYDHGDVALNDGHCTDSIYVHSTAYWIMGRASRVTKTDCGTGILARTEIGYDNLAVGVAPTDGYVTRSEVLQSLGAAEAVSTTGYDRYGRVTSVVSPNENAAGTARPSVTTYSPATGWPHDGVTVTNPAPFNTQQSTTWVSYHHGQPVQTRDVNGRFVYLSYDVLSRLTKARHGDTSSTTPNFVFEYTIDPAQASPARVRSRQLQAAVGEGGAAEYLDSYTFLDGMGRTLETQAPSPAGGRIVTATRYTDRGQVAGQSQPFHNTAAPGGALANVAADVIPVEARTDYDFFGRPTISRQVAVNVEQWRTSTAYLGTHHTVTAPVRRPVTYHIDALGRTNKVIEALVSGSATTQYGFSRLGELTRITDSAGAVTTYGYDLAGHRTSVTDPDTGTWTYRYDWNGNQTTVIGGKQNAPTNPAPDTLLYSYDELDRRTAVYQDSIGEATKLAAWTYDSAPGGIGKPASSSRILPGGHRYTSTVIGYDSRGRATGGRLSLPADPTLGPLAGTSYDTTTGYDDADHPVTATFPTAGGLAAETLTFDFSPLGLPQTVTGTVGPTPYIAATRHGPTGLLRGRDLGAGSALTVRDYNYDPLNRLSTIKATVPSASTPIVQDDTYSYDTAGNITGIARGAVGQRECFQYTDGLNRLTRAFTRSTSAACAGTPNPDSTGPAPYDKSYSYSPTGNISTVTDHKLPAGADTSTFTYDPTAKPHAVRTISGVNPGSYGYDANGAMETRSTGGISSTLAWDRLHKLSSITIGTAVTSFVYDADGQRLLRRDANGRITLYAAGMEIVAVGGTVTATRFYPGGAMRKTGEPVKWILTDHQNSTLAVVTANGTSTTTVTRPQDPFGARRTSDALPTERGFLGKPEDPTGLVATDNRYYDPAIGRFISVDPLLRPENPQSLNGYSYSYNNPATMSDPSGLDPPCERMGTCSDGTPDGIGNSDGSGRTGGVVGNADGGAAYGGANPPPPPPPVESRGDRISRERVEEHDAMMEARRRHHESITAGMDETTLGDIISGTGNAAIGYRSCTTEFSGGGCSASVFFALPITRGVKWGFKGLKGGINLIRGARAAKAVRAPRVLRVGDLKLPGVPKGATGTPVHTGKGVEYSIPGGTPELDPRVTSLRIMDPVTSGPYQYPNGYAVYMNRTGQTVNPLTGQTISPADPLAHIPLR